MYKLNLVLLFNLLVTTLCASNYGYHYITNGNGLSNSSITCIYQDSSQLMWFGTWDGLNLYDGNKFKIYKHEPSNANSISNNVIRGIVEQTKGIIWIATDHGVNRFCVKTGDFKRYYLGYDNISPAKENIYCIAKSGSGQIFCAVQEWGLAYYNENLEQFVAINIPGIKTYDIASMHYDANGLWVVKLNGAIYRLAVVVTDDGEISIVTSDEQFKNQNIKSLIVNTNDSFWLYDAFGILKLYDTKQNRVIKSYKIPNSYSLGRLSSVVETKDGLLLSLSMSHIYLYSHGMLQSLSQLENSNTLYMYKGIQDILWIGTDGQGVIMMYDKNVNFNNVSSLDLQQSKFSPIRAFYEDKSGNMWVGTKGDGIKIWNSRSGLHSVLSSDQGLSNNSVYAIQEGLSNDLLIGTDGAGLDIYSFIDKTLKPLDLSFVEGKSCEFSSVYCIVNDKEHNTLWLGTSGYGLVKIELKGDLKRYQVADCKLYRYDKNVSNSISNNIIYSIIERDADHLWIGTRGGGLNLFNKKTGQFSAYTSDVSNPRSLTSNDIISMYRSRNGTLWIGTSYGLNKMTTIKERVEFEQYTQKDGLSNNTIHGIVEDSLGYIWVSTNKGLSKLNAQTGYITNYHANDELQSDEFSDGASYKTKNGTIYFGGISGFNYFSSFSIKERNFEPPIIITDFVVKNRDVKSSIDSNRSEITLDYDEGFFSISFVALDYIRNNSCEYAYILEGFNTEWSNVGSSNTANFTNVLPGNYVFRIKSTNGDKNWCNNELVLAIHVRSPWWKTWWAYTIESLLLVLVFWFVYSLIKKRVEFNRRLFIGNLSQQQQQQIHEAKLRFFTNIAHEFCTPLTLIYGPCEKLLAGVNLDSDQRRYIGVIKSNAVRMQGLIMELMDFRKIETDHFALKLIQIDVAVLVSCVVDNFAEKREENRIDFRLNIDDDSVKWVSDRESFEKILYNLISNAYKYTPIGGYISVTVERDGGELLVKVVNSGKGIKPEDINTIFDRFKILDSYEKQASEGNLMRTGIGLALTQSLVTLLDGTISVESELNNCTTFLVRFRELQPDAQADNILSINTPEHEIGNVECGTHITVRPSGEMYKILVVDDEKDIRNLISDILSDQYIIIEAENGIDALEVIRYGRPDLIITDVVMPKMDGLALVEELKQNRFTSHIPVIFLTSKISIEDKINSYEYGVDAYISKPFHPRYLSVVVNKILQNRLSLKQYYNSILSSSDMFEGAPIDEIDQNFIMKFTAFIEENIHNEQLNPLLISSGLSLSKMNIYRKVKQITHMSPSEYIRLVRLKFAANLLLTTKMTVQEIMYNSGFNNKSYFYREFAKRYNMSPKEYRNRTNNVE